MAALAKTPVRPLEAVATAESTASSRRTGSGQATSTVKPNAMGGSGDGGIDGIIKEDRLGLDIVYVQAKRWEAQVGRPEIQEFAGALQGQRARKGVFITTSS